MLKILRVSAVAAALCSATLLTGCVSGGALNAINVRSVSLKDSQPAFNAVASLESDKLALIDNLVLTDSILFRRVAGLATALRKQGASQDDSTITRAASVQVLMEDASKGKAEAITRLSLIIPNYKAPRKPT